MTAARSTVLVQKLPPVTVGIRFKPLLLPPWAPFTQAPDYGGVTQVHFDNVFGGSRRILISSLIAYLFAQFTDIAIFHLIKARSHNRFLWLRATGSTIVSQLIDTVIIQSLAWYGLMSTGELINLITIVPAVPQRTNTKRSGLQPESQTTGR